MVASKKTIVLYAFLVCFLLILFVVNISLGSVSIPLIDIIKGVFGQKMSKESWDIIFFNFRLPKALTALFTGIALSISGLLMQTLFRNPLAGPYVLGLTSGASLGVGFLILGSSFLPAFVASFFMSSYGIVLTSGMGSAVVLLAILFVSKKIKDTTSILLVGLMFGSFSSAVVSILTYFSTAQELQKFTFWTLGSLANLGWHEIVILAVITCLGIGISFLVIKPLDALLLGERYAQSVGINFKKTRFLIILATSLLAGGITAFVGPIAFIGLAVPHLAKLLFQTSNHLTLFFSTLLLGAIILLLCDCIAQLPGSHITLPINAVTSVLGAPIVIWLLVKKRNFN
ncbi:MAG TPA: iron ABC transporter [Flavobacterium sp.]|nr:iron ABC transporter [Flavobacterium sp.]